MHNRPTPWTLASTDWLDADRVELLLTAGDAEALVTCSVYVELPRAAHEGALFELSVLDVEGAALDAAAEVARHTDALEREFWAARAKGWWC